jgi:hypothetical protein
MGVLWAELSRRVQFWRQLGASPELVEAIEFGVIKPELVSTPDPYDMGEAWLEREELEAWESLKDRYLDIGAIKVVTPAEAPYINEAFMVPKATGGFRGVVDLRPFNYHCVEYPTQFDHIYSLSQSVQAGDLMSSFDLQDGYFHLKIHEDYQVYFGFRVQGVTYIHVALPFGWSGSPHWFMRLSRQLGGWMASPPSFELGGQQFSLEKGIRHGVLLDDFLLLFQEQEDGAAAVPYVQALLELLGLKAHPEKSSWELEHVKQHLGLIVDTLEGKFYIPPAKIEKIKSYAKWVLSEVSRERRWVPARMVARMAGLSVCVSLAFPGGRLFAQGLYESLRAKASWEGKVKLTRQAVKDVKALASFPARWNGSFIWTPAADATLITDASDVGWGAILEAGERHLEAQGYWGPHMAGQHIMVRETAGVRLGLREFLPRVQGKVVEVIVDNSATFYGTKNWVSRSPELMAQLRKIFRLCDEWDIVVIPRLVKSAANPADSLSRFQQDAEWGLSRRGFNLIEALYGPHTIDMFASDANAKLPKFYSMLGGGKATGDNALLQCWEGENAYAAPPWKLLGAVVNKLDSCRSVECTLVVPDFPGARWYAPALANAKEVRSVSLWWCHRSGLKAKWPCLLLRFKKAAA